jgi:hypothetical protein
MKAEQAKIGTRVRSLRDFSGVPKGTEGVIDQEYNLGHSDGWLFRRKAVMVAWDLPGSLLPKGLPKGYRAYDGVTGAGSGILRDGFSPEEFEDLEVEE